MANEDGKARAAFRMSLSNARDDIRRLLAGDPLPRVMHEDVLDILEHIESVLEDETPEERDASVDKAVEDLT